jgi:Flp pilus assembly protein TadG
LVSERHRKALVPRHGARKSRGSALTEFALVIPFLLTGIFGVIDFGRALYSYHFVSSAAREASRWASVRGKGCTAYATDCPVTMPDSIQDYVAAIAPFGIDRSPAKLQVNASWPPPPTGGNSCKQTGYAGCAVLVTVTYNFKFVLPFLPSGTIPMKSTSEMVISK